MLVGVADRTLASEASCAEVEAVLARQEHRDGIPAGLPEGTYVANKTGWVEGIAHDMALVRPDGRPPYVLVVLTTVDLPERGGPGPDRRREPHRLEGMAGMTRIAQVSTTRLSSPLHTPFVTALRRTTTTDTVVVRVTDERRRDRLGRGAAGLAGDRRVARRGRGLRRGPAGARS